VKYEDAFCGASVKEKTVDETEIPIDAFVYRNKQKNDPLKIN
jgi:hypothetical protein